MFDLIIIGAGPAGITASVYAARKMLKVLVISEDVGGQTAWSGSIENYTGYQLISGPDLAAKFEEHLRTFAIELHENEAVTGIKKIEKKISLVTNKGSYEAGAVIIASGKRSRELGVPGEKEFRNKGLTYCATCDGPLFANKRVVVAGGGNSALDATLQLMKIALHVTIVNTASDLTGDPVMQEQVRAAQNVTLLNYTKITAIVGENMVSGVKIKDDHKEEILPAQGVFVEIGLVPNAQFSGDVVKNHIGEIKVNCRNETNIPGIFAAGDVTDVPEKQIIVAAGEGAKAALSAFRYVMRNPLTANR